jgi:uncharacterized protein (TIGR00369 family)
MEGGNEPHAGPGLHVVADGEWAGWWAWTETDPYEDVVGPFHWRRQDDGAVRCAFRAQTRHMNGYGFMHGGCIMTFADYALFVIAKDALEDAPAVTVTLNSEFVGSIAPGALVEATGEVVRATGRLVFARGLISADGAPALTFSGVLKRIKAT